MEVEEEKGAEDDVVVTTEDLALAEEREVLAASSLVLEGDDDEQQLEFVLMYNSVRGYVSAIKELWGWQTSRGLHAAPCTTGTVARAYRMGILRGQHGRRRGEFEDLGVGSMRDGYSASQIPDVTYAVWSLAMGRSTAEQSLRTGVDFLLGNSMLMRLSNRRSLKLADLFLMRLPKEGVKGDGWCMVAIMDQGKFFLVFD